MSQRKISECINVRINVGNYQHIELSKYAEETVEYSSKEELIQKEDSLRDDLIASVIRSMKAIPERLGKGVEAAIEVEESIKKAIPSWLENGAVPNIANLPKKKNLQDVAEQKNNKDEAVKNLAEVTETVVPEVKKEQVIAKGTEAIKPTVNDDLFEDDSIVEVIDGIDKMAVEKSPEVVETKKVEKSAELDGFFDNDDDDLFGDI
jgi:hypothetical protein